MSNKHPFTFNQLKHHIATIKQFIQEFDQPMDDLSLALSCIGHAKMDLYVGQKSCTTIFEEILSCLKKEGILEQTNYKKWLQANDDYRQITLSDNSVWILRLGEDEKNYIHLHPGKKSPHTLRIKANTLKTAIAIMLHEKDNTDPVDLDTLNQLRSKYLDLSPVHRDITTAGLKQLREFL